MSSLIVMSKLKELAKQAGLNVSAGFPEAFEKNVMRSFEEAAKRTKANNRKTLMEHDA